MNESTEKSEDEQFSYVTAESGYFVLWPCPGCGTSHKTPVVAWEVSGGLGFPVTLAQVDLERLGVMHPDGSVHTIDGVTFRNAEDFYVCYVSFEVSWSFRSHKDLQSRCSSYINYKRGNRFFII